MKKAISLICIYSIIFTSFLAYGSNHEKKDTATKTYASEELLVYPSPIKVTSTDSIQTPEQTATPTPTPTPTQTQTPIKKQKKEKTPPDLNIPLDYDIQIYIYKQCQYDDDLYCFIMALIKQESGFDEKEVSSTNDYGLMQINACNHDSLQDKYGKKNFLDPYDNVYCGIRIIKGYLKEYEYKNLALMAYNMGEGGARRLWKKGIYSSEYSRKVTEYYNKYKKALKN